MNDDSNTNSSTIYSQYAISNSRDSTTTTSWQLHTPGHRAAKPHPVRRGLWLAPTFGLSQPTGPRHQIYTIEYVCIYRCIYIYIYIYIGIHCCE